MNLRRGLTFFVGLFCSLSSFAQTETPDCLEIFFTPKSKLLNRNLVFVSQPGAARTAFNRFWKDNYMEQTGRAALADIDGDGTKELLVSNFTGGAHCCDEFYIFKKAGANQYTQTARLFAGSTCYADSIFVFDIHESYGYFFTCYACALEAERGKKGAGLQAVSTVNLRYAAGKMAAVAGDDRLRQRLLANLAVLKKLGWDGGLKEGEFDDGRRKELALNLAVYHFSFGQNLAVTKQLFTTYYPWKDAAAVWKEFSSLLTNVRKNMSL